MRQGCALTDAAKSEIVTAILRFPGFPFLLCVLVLDSCVRWRLLFAFLFLSSLDPLSRLSWLSSQS